MIERRRIHSRLAAGSSGHQHRQLAVGGERLFGDGGAPAERIPGGVCVRGRRDACLAPAIVSAATTLDEQRTELPRNCLQLCGRCYVSIRADWKTVIAKPRFLLRAILY